MKCILIGTTLLRLPNGQLGKAYYACANFVTFNSASNWREPYEACCVSNAQYGVPNGI